MNDGLIEAIIGTVLLIGFTIVFGYLSWVGYLNFYDSAQRFIWDWNSFNGMVFNLFFSGFTTGMSVIAVQMLMKEIKKGLQMREKRKLNEETEKETVNMQKKQK